MYLLEAARNLRKNPKGFDTAFDDGKRAAQRERRRTTTVKKVPAEEYEAEAIDAVHAPASAYRRPALPYDERHGVFCVQRPSIEAREGVDEVVGREVGEVVRRETQIRIGSARPARRHGRCGRLLREDVVRVHAIEHRVLRETAAETGAEVQQCEQEPRHGIAKGMVARECLETTDV